MIAFEHHGRLVWVNAALEPGGNWMTDNVPMVTSLYSDLRLSGNWAAVSDDNSNTTGIFV